MNWNGNDDLRPLLAEVDSLHLDPANTNVHDEESISVIAASYAEYGQQKPIVVSQAGVVKDGNGQLMAARKLGWTHLAISRSDLPDVKLTLYGIAANRTAEFSHPDEAKIAAVLDLARESEPIEATGYSLDDLDELLGASGHAGGFGAGKPADGPEGDAGAAEGGGADQAGDKDWNPAIRFELVFDDVDQQDRWFAFVKWLKSQAEYDAATIAGRLDKYLVAQGLHEAA